MIRTVRSLLFSVIYPIYLGVVMGTTQELVIRPLCALMPKRRAAIMRAWLRYHAQAVMGMAQHLGGLRLHVRGTLPEASCIVIMNHQSLLDIPVGISLIRGPCPLIPTRSRYTRGVPVVSRLARLSGFPSLSQGERLTREEHHALAAAAEAVERGERTFLIFPEGHRSPDGQIQPFMTSGLRMVFRRARHRPVYLAVVDGLWRQRSVADIALRLGGSRVTVEILGPYEIPPDHRDHEEWIGSLRAEMLSTLERIRARSPEPPRLATRVQLAG